MNSERDSSRLFGLGRLPKGLTTSLTVDMEIFIDLILNLSEFLSLFHWRLRRELLRLVKLEGGDVSGSWGVKTLVNGGD